MWNMDIPNSGRKLPSGWDNTELDYFVCYVTIVAVEREICCSSYIDQVYFLFASISLPQDSSR